MQKRIGIFVATFVFGLTVIGCQEGAVTDLPTGSIAELDEILISTPIVDKGSAPCCTGMRGNVDNDPNDLVDISDLVYLVDYIYHGGPAPACGWEADVDGDGGITSTDIDYLVDFMFKGGPPPVDCY